MDLNRVIQRRKHRLGQTLSTATDQFGRPLPSKKGKVTDLVDLQEAITEILMVLVEEGSVTGPAAEWIKAQDLLWQLAYKVGHSHLLNFITRIQADVGRSGKPLMKFDPLILTDDQS